MKSYKYSEKMVKFVTYFRIKILMISRRLIIVLTAALMGMGLSMNAQDMREAVRLFDHGMYSRARSHFEDVASARFDADPEGYAVLCDVKQAVPGYRRTMDSFIADNPQSPVIPQIRYAHAMNLFDAQEYVAAGKELAQIKVKHLDKSQRTEFTFKKAYCALESGQMQDALEGFKEVEKMPASDFSAPSRYVIGYINYELKDFKEAVQWFEKSVNDSRFAELSSYYIMECRFMMADYAYVTKKGDEMYAKIPQERKPQLARIISESWLVLGDAEKARKYMELNAKEGGQPSGRADWFYRGSVLYAVHDYKGAIDSYSMMGERTDSIGQIASYQLGYCYIQTKNKVAALEAFKSASFLSYDKNIEEDAYFNYAKLAFDLNNDSSVFYDYQKKYSDSVKGERIYSYMAVAALHNRDYEGAVEAYGMIDYLDGDMRSNYMKANYLRAEQLISRGSYRKAIPCLKAAAYYSERGSRFNQLSRFWLAESYYRNDEYAQARSVFMDLYNTSALYGREESGLIVYNIAYTYYKEGNYALADKWFSEYLSADAVKFRKDALERKGDCHFISKQYKDACAAYDQVLKSYFDVNDIYPYYQSALSYGLAKNTDKKIQLLSNVLEASPEAEFYAEAIYELGRSYAVKEDDENAFMCFSRIADCVKDSTYVAKAYIEMGSISRNQSQYNEALGYYKTVVEQMPMSGYAEDALIAIESIYQTKNEPEEYLAYIETIGKGATKTADEREIMIFNSAEQIFLSENYNKALVSLQSYLDKYPDGKFTYKADFYMAESYKSLGKKEQACDSYKKVISEGEGSFVELSMLNYANISFSLERWEDAYGGYMALYNSARLENNTFVALTGMMRSAFKAHDWENAVQKAEMLAADSRSDADLRREADYVKAKSYLASSRRDAALDLLDLLACNLEDAYGAESAYILIVDSYDRGEFTEVENMVYAFADSGSGQTYWLAKSFIVLGDSFMERGELKQAKATFESVRDGYTAESASDDVPSSIEMRLAKLEQIEKENI